MFAQAKKMLCVVLLMVSSIGCSARNQAVDAQTRKPLIQIILGSTRQGRSSDKIGKALLNILANRTDISAEIIDLRDYRIPFLDDAVAPASRKSISDPIIQTWSDTIADADAFIIVVPEYNSGYPGVLKNALDSLYAEWAHKPVGFVGYSGGPSGAATAVAQLRQVAQGLGMVPVAQAMNIGSAWKALNNDGTLVNTTSAQELNRMVDQIVAARKK